MRLNTNQRIIFAIMTIVFTNCATQKVSTLVGYDYDVKKNQTDYFIIPYGSVSIPDKWVKSNYNSSSRQQFFKNSDSITIAIAFGPCNKFEFNSDMSLKGFEFVKTYYEWDSKYYVDNHGFSRELIEQDSISNYLIWRLSGTLDKNKIDNYFLFGEKNCKVSNFSILRTDKWTEGQKVEFLKRLYQSEK